VRTREISVTQSRLPAKANGNRATPIRRILTDIFFSGLRERRINRVRNIVMYVKAGSSLA